MDRPSPDSWSFLMAYHIRLVAIGTRGDVQPYVALGLGLQSAGYDVTVVTTRDFAAFVTGAGLAVLVSPFDLRGTLASSANRRNNRHARFALFDDMLAHLVPLCRGADLVRIHRSPASSCPTFWSISRLPG
jgi:UDP:flavonoid glycosyltransferase YjiC (YdhE family)